jgi:hypothetical protein
MNVRLPTADAPNLAGATSAGSRGSLPRLLGIRERPIG